MPPATKKFEIEADARNLSPLRVELRAALEAAGFDSKAVHGLLLSVDEVLTNIIRHAYGEATNQIKKGRIRVSLSDQGDRMEITIEDGGPCFDPRQVSTPKLPREKPGGLGIHLVRSLTDEIHYEPLRPQGNRLRLVKYKTKKGESSKC